MFGINQVGFESAHAEPVSLEDYEGILTETQIREMIANFDSQLNGHLVTPDMVDSLTEDQLASV